MGGRCAIPISNVVEVALARPEAVHWIGDLETILLRDEILPMYRLEDMFGRAQKGDTLVVAAERRQRNVVSSLITVEANRKWW